jgi:hypothetical protein
MWTRALQLIQVLARQRGGMSGRVRAASACVAVVLFVCSTWSQAADTHSAAVCVVPRVPDSLHPSEMSPNGETNAVRYQQAYQSYCWNCVAVRAKRLEARCPMICSGNEAATAGCTAGAVAGDASVERLIQAVGRERARTQLRTLAAEAVTRGRLDPYFAKGPQEAPAPK